MPGSISRQSRACLRRITFPPESKRRRSCRSCDWEFHRDARQDCVENIPGKEKLDHFLEAAAAGNLYLPLYTMVTFTRIPYAEAAAARRCRIRIVCASIFALDLLIIVLLPCLRVLSDDEKLPFRRHLGPDRLPAVSKRTKIRLASVASPGHKLAGESKRKKAISLKPSLLGRQ